MELREVMRTTPATREWVAEPVSDEALYSILDTARFAPSGGNRQAWRLIVVADPDVKRAIATLYAEGAREYDAATRPGHTAFAALDLIDGVDRASGPSNEGAPQQPPTGQSEFAQRLSAAPVLLVLLADLAAISIVDQGVRPVSVVAGASLYPFVQNVLLAARDHGYGGVMTTVAIRREPQVKQLLGIPREYAVAGVIALGRPAHEVTRLRRRRVESFTTVDRFDGPPFTHPEC